MEGFADITRRLFSRAKPEKGDYYGEDGLLICGKCKTRKESRIVAPIASDGGEQEVIVPVVCKCRKKELEEQRKKQEYKEQMQRIEQLRKSSLIESKFKNARLKSFKRTGQNEKLFKIAGRYVENFHQMYENNQGILFWGAVGTGKSFTAACIANELLAGMTTVVMTSFVKILQAVQDFDVDEAAYMEKLNGPKLLIIDDLGTERNTDYALEKVYNVIDSRYRVKKPLILTTNLTLAEMQNETDIRYRRIYDRIFEMCYPVHVTGRSWREKEAEKRFDDMKKLMEG